MIENKEMYLFREAENAVVKSFTVLKGEKVLAEGYVGISDEELLTIYETDPELAAKDGRLEELLNREPEEEQATEMEQLQADIAYIKMKLKG